MTGALPEAPAPQTVRDLLELAADLLSTRDALAVARNAASSAPTDSRIVEAIAESLDAEVRGLDEILACLYRLVELAEDIWEDVGLPESQVPPNHAAALYRAAGNAFLDLRRLTGIPQPTSDSASETTGKAPHNTDIESSAEPSAPIDTRAVAASWVGAPAEDVYASVKVLTRPARRLLALAEPRAVGSTYGVPWRMRAFANAVEIRRTLHREQVAGTPWSPRIGRLETMLRRVPDPGPRSGDPDDSQSSGLRQSAENAPRPPVRRVFIAFSPERSGRMIELVGRVGPECDAVGVYVPGTGTNLDMSHVNTDVAANLVAASEGRLAVLAFLDGEFPQDILSDAGDMRFAESMAPRLVRFCREIDRVLEIESPGAALTVIGHSYGGRIVGTAERLGLRCDRVLYAESPDIGVEVSVPSDWRNPAPVMRFSLTAPADPVELLQIRSGLRARWSTSDLGGATLRLDTGYFSDGELVYGTRGHGGVFDAESDSFQAILAVLLGGTATLWRDRDIRAAHTRVRAGSEGRIWPTVWRHAMGLGLHRANEPYSQPQVLMEKPPQEITIPRPQGRSRHRAQSPAGGLTENN